MLDGQEEDPRTFEILDLQFAILTQNAKTGSLTIESEDARKAVIAARWTLPQTGGRFAAGAHEVKEILLGVTGVAAEVGLGEALQARRAGTAAREI